MRNDICYDNVRRFAYVNDAFIQGNIRGIILDFFGHGVQNFYREDYPSESVRFGQKGLLHIVPYTNPWCWGNMTAIDYSRRILQVVSDRFSLQNAPLTVCGASMGGLTALIYALRSDRVPIACVTNCPVCDLTYHYTEHDDMPRSIMSAFYGDDKALRASSPIENVTTMPTATQYTVFQCDCDSDVHPEHHADVFVPLMRESGHQVTHIHVPDSEHCQLNAEYLDMYYAAIENAFTGK